MKALSIFALLFSLCLLPCWADKWTHYTDCKLDKDGYSDGDSFHIEVKLSRTYNYIFRLYFVDTAESDQQVPSRVQQQADYWDIEYSEALSFGEDAGEFSKKWMKKHDFDVYTKHEDARGRSKKKRRYAMLQDKKTGEYLSEALVSAGLARVYGRDTTLPNGRSAKKQWSTLRNAEKKAKEQRLGAWGSSKGLAKKKAPTSRPKLLPGGLPELPTEPTEKTITLSTLVYSLKDKSPRGRLNSGMTITILGPADPGMARVRFSPSPEKVYEGQCKKSDLGYR